MLADDRVFGAGFDVRISSGRLFFEGRYSRNFRMFAGLLAFLSGIFNFGIFPAVSARFFIYFCGLPKSVDVFGLQISTFAVIMFVLLFAYAVWDSMRAKATD